MNQEKLWIEFSTLSPQAQALVWNFIQFVKKCSEPFPSSSTSPQIQASQIDFGSWMTDVRSVHPFSQKSKEDIMTELKKTRNEVYEEFYGERHAR